MLGPGAPFRRSLRPPRTELARRLMRARLVMRRLIRALKRRLPTSLFMRSLLMIVLPVAIMQIAVTYIFYEAHWRLVTSRLSEALAGDVAWAVESYEQNPSPVAFARVAARAQRTMSLSIVFQPHQQLPRIRHQSLFAPIDHAVERALTDRLHDRFWFQTTSYRDWVDIRVAVQGGVIRILAPRDRAFATQGHIFVLWVIVTTVLLTGIALLFIRSQVRAIERLAAAADAFGRGGEPVAFAPQGASEVRRAATAFLEMQGRIQRQIEQRTTLLAAVSHDLRTPLTRLKLELALSDNAEEAAAMKRDLAEMEKMIDEYLAFVREQGAEPVRPVRLRELLDEVAATAPADGAVVQVLGDEELAAEVRPQALKAALERLVGEACARSGRVDLQACAQGRYVDLLVDDDGPGPEPVEEAAGGVGAPTLKRPGVGGLSLSIVRDVVRSHGGEVRLSASPLGGVRAAISLPAMPLDERRI